MIPELSRKHKKTLEDIFKRPIPSDIRIEDVKSLVVALGGTVSTKGRTSGCRIRLTLFEMHANIHEPHPGNELCKATIKDLREFFEFKIGIKP